MTLREKLKKMLTDRGMFDSQAEAVLVVAIPQIEKAAPDYRFTWDRPASEYPEMIYEVMWLHLSKIALDWIDKNSPQAWFRGMFTW